MAAGFQYFTSADSGAPAMSASVGRLIAVLDWVMVTKGGWTKPYTGTNLAVYRSNTGNRFYLRVDDTQAKYARTRAYRAMTAVSTGTSMFPTAAQAVAANWGTPKGYTAGTTARRYWGVRTDRYVLLFIETYSPTADGGSTVQMSCLAFGDVPSLCESDAHASILWGADDVLVNGYFPSPYCLSSAYADPVQTIPAATAGVVGISGTPDGSLVSPNAGVIQPYPHYTGDAAAAARTAKCGRLNFSPYAIWSGEISGVAAGSGCYPRARIPNLHMVAGGIQPTATANSPVYDRENFALGARQFIALSDYNEVSNPRWSSASLLEKTDTDGAL